VQWIAVPLAIVGVVRSGGFLRRFLSVWLIVIAVGVPIGWLTGLYPPDRLVTFGFAVPVAAGIGLVWLHRGLNDRPWLAWTVVVLAAGWMIGGAMLAWLRQEPFVSVEEARAIDRATGIVDAPAGTPLVFVVDDGDPSSTFLAARVANLARAAVSPDRAADVYVFLGTVTDLFADRPTERGDPEFDAMSEATLASMPTSSERQVIVDRHFYALADADSDPHLVPYGRGLYSSVDRCCTPGEMTGGRLAFEPTSGGAITFAAMAILVVIGLLGLGYAWAFFDGTVSAIATAPAFGATTVSLAAVLLDALGLRLDDLWVAVAASALAGLGGLAVLVAQRRRRAEPPA
jgi:hypothetical protein